MTSAPALLRIPKGLSRRLSARAPLAAEHPGLSWREVRVGCRLGRRSPVHLPMYVQEVALPRGPWASLSEEKFRRGRVEGHTTTPVATFGLKLSVVPALSPLHYLFKIPLALSYHLCWPQWLPGGITQILIPSLSELLLTTPFSGPCLFTIKTGGGSARMGMPLAVGAG